MTTVAPPPTACTIDGCQAYAVYTVVKDRREKLVCRKCAAEMIHVFGWRLI
jgi:hypothetical protein